MKRKNQVINAAKVRRARQLIRWVASGCNWASGPEKEALKSAARSLLARGPVFFQKFADAVNGFGHVITQSSATYFVLAAAGRSTADDLRQMAQEREDERPQWANWTYDDQTQWHWDVAGVCDKLAKLA